LISRQFQGVFSIIRIITLDYTLMYVGIYSEDEKPINSVRNAGSPNVRLEGLLVSERGFSTCLDCSPWLVRNMRLYVSDHGTPMYPKHGPRRLGTLSSISGA
jgi:hypothetical protein